MKRHYRIDRFNGMDLLVCEVFQKHTWSQNENDAFFQWKEEQEKTRPDQLYLPADFKYELEEALKREDVKEYFGLKEPIPVFNWLPSIILRGPVFDNRIMSLQVEYDGSVLPPVIFEEIRRFYDVVDSLHWRNMIAHQVEDYGTLFTSPDD